MWVFTLAGASSAPPRRPSLISILDCVEMRFCSDRMQCWSLKVLHAPFLRSKARICCCCICRSMSIVVVCIGRAPASCSGPQTRATLRVKLSRWACSG
eukprot:2163657-Rhodomonas_salina.1